MTANGQADLMEALKSELDSMSAENAERLCVILKGLFACMQDLNARMAVLEGQQQSGPGSGDH